MDVYKNDDFWRVVGRYAVTLFGSHFKIRCRCLEVGYDIGNYSIIESRSIGVWYDISNYYIYLSLDVWVCDMILVTTQ